MPTGTIIFTHEVFLIKFFLFFKISIVTAIILTRILQRNGPAERRERRNGRRRKKERSRKIRRRERKRETQREREMDLL